MYGKSYKKKKSKKMVKKASELTVREYLEKTAKATTMIDTKAYMYGEPLTSDDQKKLKSARNLYRAGNVAGTAGNLAILGSIPVSMLTESAAGRKAAGYMALGGLGGILSSYGLRGLGKSKAQDLSSAKYKQALKNRLKAQKNE